MPKLKPKTIKRDRLFYDQFEWSLNFRVKGAHLARKLSHEDLDIWLARWHGIDSVLKKIKTANLITPQDHETLHALIDVLNPLPRPCKFYFSHHWIYVYHNDLAVLEQLATWPHMDQIVISQAVVDRPRDVIVKRRPKYSYRTYFRDHIFRDMDKGRMFREFLQRQDHWNRSGALDRTMDNGKYFYVQRHHFVDHDNPQDALLMNLHTPNIVRKTVPIQAK
jgi:hypothetical protein